jgi:hypothetical protein
VSDERDDSLLATLPGLARIAASTWWHTTEFWVGAYVRAGRRVAKAAIGDESPAVLLEDTRAAVRSYARELLNLAEEPVAAVPTVDVRAGLPMATHLVAPGLNMIGAEAGARYGDRVPAYLNNLYRLGLIWFSREPLEPHRYQVLEAQPDVLAALRSGRQSRTMRRSIHLTPFGQDFCETCLPLHTAELERLPGAAVPPEEPAAAPLPQRGDRSG